MMLKYGEVSPEQQAVIESFKKTDAMLLDHPRVMNGRQFEVNFASSKHQ